MGEQARHVGPAKSFNIWTIHLELPRVPLAARSPSAKGSSQHSDCRMNSLQGSHRCAAWALFQSSHSDCTIGFRVYPEPPRRVAQTQAAPFSTRRSSQLETPWRCLSFSLLSPPSSASAAGSSAGPGSAAPGPRELEARQLTDSKCTLQLRTLCALRRRRHHGRKRGALVCFLNSGCPNSQSLREPWEGTTRLQITKPLNSMTNCTDWPSLSESLMSTNTEDALV